MLIFQGFQIIYKTIYRNVEKSRKIISWNEKYSDFLNLICIRLYSYLLKIICSIL